MLIINLLSVYAPKILSTIHPMPRYSIFCTVQCRFAAYTRISLSIDALHPHRKSRPSPSHTLYMYMRLVCNLTPARTSTGKSTTHSRYPWCRIKCGERALYLAKYLDMASVRCCVVRLKCTCCALFGNRSPNAGRKRSFFLRPRAPTSEPSRTHCTNPITHRLGAHEPGCECALENINRYEFNIAFILYKC